MNTDARHSHFWPAILAMVVTFLLAVVFSGVAVVGGWHAAARFLPFESEPVTLANWVQVERFGNPRWGTSGGQNAVFELENALGEVDRIFVPDSAWQRRVVLSRQETLWLDRSRLGGLPVSLWSEGRVLSEVVPEGGLLEQLIQGGDDSSAAVPKETFDLLIPFFGAVCATLLGLGIWLYLLVKLCVSKSLNFRQPGLQNTFVIGSLVGVAISIVWFG